MTTFDTACFCTPCIEADWDRWFASGGSAAAEGAAGVLSRNEVQQSRLDKLEHAYWSEVFTLDCLRAEECDYLGRYNSHTSRVKLDECYGRIERLCDLIERQRSVMDNECRIEAEWWNLRIGDEDQIPF